MSVRGDRERDRAELERDFAHEKLVTAGRARGELRERYLKEAELHSVAAALLEQLADVYDEHDGVFDSGPSSVA